MPKNTQNELLLKPKAKNTGKRREYNKEYYQKTKVKKSEYSKEYYQRNKTKIKEYQQKNKDRIKHRKKEYYQKNKDKIKWNKKEWYENNQGKVKEYRKKYYEQHKVKIKKSGNEYYESNKGKRREYSKKYLYSFTLFTTYANQLTIEEDSKEGEDGKLLVKCTYCGKYFCPITICVVSRLASLRGYGSGEHRLYCSDGCKSACPIYNQTCWPKGFKPASSREVDPLIRQMCLKRDNYECQKCGVSIEDAELHAHHIEGATKMPLLANDVDNTITLCKQCHKWVHSQKGCTTYDLRCKKS